MSNTKKAILAIDQGTTSTRTIVFSLEGQPLTSAQQEFKQHFPKDGWVEHDPEDLWNTTLHTLKEAVAKSKIAVNDFLGIGITNQRETTLVWERETGKPLYHAIVWQDRRTTDFCKQLRAENLSDHVQATTGLLIDPYFSATKLAWILDQIPNARERASRGEILFGTVDTFLIWRLTAGKSFKTDVTNASRTMLFNIHTQDWDEKLLQRLNIPREMLPEVVDCDAHFGDTDPDILGASLPICGVAGDQQAALIGQACFQPGMAKSTYGTGCFLILNTGDKALQSKHRLLTTIGYRLKGKINYAMEGSIFIAGATVQWLRDGLKIIQSAGETEAIAEQVSLDHGVYLVPAFTGLGAPYWDPKARGALFGLTRDTGIREIVSAGLQSVCYQTYDLLTAMAKDGADFSAGLRVDGGMVANNWVGQCLANLLKVRVDRPKIIETTALGAAFLVGLHTEHFTQEKINSFWQCDRSFEPELKEDLRQKLILGWKDAVSRVRVVE